MKFWAPTRLNGILREWAKYFSYGTRLMAYRTIDNFVYDRVRHFLRRRHKVPSRGIRYFPDEKVFGELGVLRLTACGAFSVCFEVKPVGEPDAGNPHVRFDDRRQEMELWKGLSYRNLRESVRTLLFPFS
ncbi:MAG: group II intron maturase-specific domain-containing protein [Candidatus Aminicenantaceae bacterium]